MWRYGNDLDPTWTYKTLGGGGSGVGDIINEAANGHFAQRVATGPGAFNDPVRRMALVWWSLRRHRAMGW